jgi:DNA polymerase-3 subunit delta
LKLPNARVEAFLRRPDPAIAIALLHGPDSGMVSERARRVAASIVDDLADPFRVVELEPERLRSEPQLLAEEALSLSLIGGRRLVRVRRAGDMISAAVRPILSGEPPAAFVLLEAGDLPGSSSLRKLVEAATGAVAIACYHDEGGGLAAVVRSTLEREGLAIDPEALEQLAQHLGGDRGLTTQELAKLALYVGDRDDRTVRLDDIAAIVDDSSALALEDLQRAVLLGGRDVEPLLDRLLAEGIRPEAMMRATAGLLMQALRCALIVDSGSSPSAAVAAVRPPLFGRRKELVEQALRRWRSQSLTEALASLRAAEAASRTRRAPTALICRHTLSGLPELVRRPVA